MVGRQKLTFSRCTRRRKNINCSGSVTSHSKGFVWNILCYDSLHIKRFQTILTGRHSAMILFTSSKFPHHVLAYDDLSSRSQLLISLCPDHMVSDLQFRRNRRSIFYQCHAMDDLNFKNSHLSNQTATWRNVVLMHPTWKHSAMEILLNHSLLSSTSFDWNEVQNNWNEPQNICI